MLFLILLTTIMVGLFMVSFSNSQTIPILLNMKPKSSMNSELPFPIIKYQYHTTAKPVPYINRNPSP